MYHHQNTTVITVIVGMVIVFAPYTMLRADEPSIADQSTYLSDFQQQAAKEWPANRTLNIVCHGHSVPAGYFKTPTVETFNAYPHLLHEQLKKRYPHAVINVIVTAIGGETSSSGSKRFADDVLTHKPDVITIDYALNDRRLGLEQAEASWRMMLELAAEHDIPVILLTPTADQRSRLIDPQDPLNQHAAQIRRLAAEYHVGLVDSLAQFQKYVDDGNDLAEIMSQSNHPNRAGHDLVTRELIRWFEPQPAGDQ